MKIGYASVDITPELGVELSGYGWFPERKAEGVLDNLYARAVVFERTYEDSARDNSGDNFEDNTKGYPGDNSGDNSTNATRYDESDFVVINNKKACRSMVLINCDLC